MADIVLCTFNARYTHTAIGLRYLYANLKELQERAVIKEFVIKTNITDALEQILSENPKIVGIGAYIWNAIEVSELIELIKKITPETTVVVGGPEASYFPHRVDFSKADYFVQGEGDVVFYELCRDILAQNPPATKLIKAGIVDLNAIELPYAYYNDNDVANRYTYVEASRGCPYSCEFCLSSLDKKVRKIETDRFLNELDILWNRGVRNFKFIDRTFNFNIKTANKMMDFFLEKEPPYFIHFEVIPDHFPESLRERLTKFPPTCLQLEIGIQTLDTDVADNINRKLNFEKIQKNLSFLQNETKAHLHVDLIVGLPGESVEQFGKNLDKLYSIAKCEIQIGILKKLSGTTINRHDEIHGMVYSDLPPYDILQNSLISFALMQKMKRFARFWDIVYNSGNFKKIVVYLFSDGKVFDGFFAFSQWIYAQTESTWQISLDRMAYLIFRYLTEILHVSDKEIKEVLMEDIMSVQGRRLPKFLQTHKHEEKRKEREPLTFNKRQIKHSL
jgi:hypothetical protein